MAMGTGTGGCGSATLSGPALARAAYGAGTTLLVGGGGDCASDADACGVGWGCWSISEKEPATSRARIW